MSEWNLWITLYFWMGILVYYLLVCDLEDNYQYSVLVINENDKIKSKPSQGSRFIDVYDPLDNLVGSYKFIEKYSKNQRGLLVRVLEGIKEDRKEFLSGELFKISSSIKDIINNLP